MRGGLGEAVSRLLRWRKGLPGLSGRQGWQRRQLQVPSGLRADATLLPWEMCRFPGLSPRRAVIWARIRAGQFTRPADELGALGKPWSALFNEAMLVSGPSPLEAGVGAHPPPTGSRALMGPASGQGREHWKPQQGNG